MLANVFISLCQMGLKEIHMGIDMI